MIPDLRIARRIARWFRRLAVTFEFHTVEDAYKFFGLDPATATPDEVKKAYRRLSHQYHPDLHGGGTPESIDMMKKINVAREIIESKNVGGHQAKPGPGPQGEGFWDGFRRQHGPQASGHYGDQDLRRLADHIVDKGLYQVVYRDVLDHVPYTAGYNHGGQWSYSGPFGSKRSTARMPAGVTADQVHDQLKKISSGKTIFDLGTRDRWAWVTFEMDGGKKYYSVSFDQVKAPVKKEPGTGMTVVQIDDHLRQKGLAMVAGGSKFTYWGPRGHSSKQGYFIRQAAKTLRVVRRTQVDQGYKKTIEDVPIVNEVYFGALKPETLDKWVAYVLKKNAEPSAS